MSEPLFVYGSLMSGMEQGGLLSRFSRTEATMGGRLYRMPSGSPMLVPDPDGRQIQGELVTLPHPGILQVLDLFFGVGAGRFRRVLLPAWQSGTVHMAWAHAQDAGTVATNRYVPLTATDWRRVGAPLSR